MTQNITRSIDQYDYVEGEGSPRLEGYAIVFESDSVLVSEPGLGRFIERIAPGFCRQSLEAAESGERPIKSFWSHDTDTVPLASTRNGNLILREDEKGIWFSMSTERFSRAQLLAARDGDMQMSFGMRGVQYDWSKRDDGARLGIVRQADVYEISPVAYPAYGATVAALRKAQEEAFVEAATAWEASMEAAEEPVVEDATSDRSEIDLSIAKAKLRLSLARAKSKLV